ncbi:MAG TPA: hypothetical protein VHX44_03635, partial [Planctomycetota bacterium]|nr:hypothetical protein [Planctomycetota bacterium]
MRHLHRLMIESACHGGTSAAMRIIPGLNRFSVTCLLAVGLLSAADQPATFDTTKRVLWTGSKVQGAPEPPAHYRAVRIFADVKLESPVDAQLSPDRKRWFITEQLAIIRTFPADSSAKSATVLLNLSTPDRKWDFRRNAYSLTFHPHFPENSFIYVFYHDPIPDPAMSHV